MVETMNAADIIRRIAEYADDVAVGAGVGAMETAGSIVSFLAANPDHIDAFVSGQAGMLDWPINWQERGNLSWHAANGQIVAPEFVRRMRVIKAMEARNA